jgi:hypothetical protein
MKIIIFLGLVTFLVVENSPVTEAGCSCSGECGVRYPEYEKFDNLLSCVVNQPSTCTDLLASTTNPEEQLSAEACFDPPTQDYRCSAQGHYCQSYRSQVKGSIEEVAQECKNDVNCKVFNYHSKFPIGELCSDISPKSYGGTNWKLCLLGNFEVNDGCVDSLPPGSCHNQMFVHYGESVEKVCEAWKSASFCDKPMSFLGQWDACWGNGPEKFKDYCKKTCNNCG